MIRSRLLSNILAGMLIIQVILGLSGSLLGFAAIPHLVWGGISYVVLLALVFVITKEFGEKSILLPLSLVAFADYNV